MSHTPAQTCRTLLRGGFIALATLAFAHCALALESRPPIPPEKEPAAWQQAGLEAALADPDLVVQYHALDYCIRKKWVAQLHLPTAQWLLLLGHAEPDMQALAADAAGQLGAQMPAEVQRMLARMRKSRNADQAQRPATRALLRLGTGMIPEVQMELVAALHETPPDYDFLPQFCQALGATGAAMAPATLEALLALMKDPQTGAGSFAAAALAHLGPHMPPQVREHMLGLLLDARESNSLRDTAAEALGRLGPQMPPQAQQLFLAVLRDPAAQGNLRAAAPAALAQLGPQMPPEVPQALLAAYDEPPPKADNDAREYHDLLQAKVEQALELMGPDMPPALQQGLLERFLKTAQASKPPDFTFGIASGPLHAKLRILAKAGTHVSPAVLHTLLAGFQSPAASDIMREIIAESFLQELADHAALPPDAQHTLLVLLQDGAASLNARGHAAVTLGCLAENTSPEIRRALLVLLQDKDLDKGLRFSVLQAMEKLGPHMPPEAAPVLVGILQKNIAFSAAQAPVPSPAADPFGPGAAPASIPAPAAGAFSMPDQFPIEHAVPALGNLGEKMPPEAQSALLRVMQHQVGTRQTPWDAAFALARMGDKLPPQMQQSLLTLLRQPGLDYHTSLAIRQTLGVSGIHPVTDAQLAELLAMTYAGEPDPELRTYLYLWLGRSPAHLQAVRWLGHQGEDPPLGDTPPHEILSLISRLWPHAAKHAELRHEMARRSGQIITTHVKTYPLDDATRKVLRTLSAQLNEDTAPDCAEALAQVKAALAADEKAR